jgi:hypothetical protein
VESFGTNQDFTPGSAIVAFRLLLNTNKVPIYPLIGDKA